MGNFLLPAFLKRNTGRGNLRSTMSTEPQSIFCSKCRAQGASGALICYKCGARLLKPECVVPKVEETQNEHRPTESHAVGGLEDGKNKRTDAYQASSFPPELAEPKPRTAFFDKVLLARGETNSIPHNTMLMSLFVAGVDLLLATSMLPLSWQSLPSSLNCGVIGWPPLSCASLLSQTWYTI